MGRHMALFKKKTIRDPQTGNILVITPEDQLDMLEHGILLDVPSEPSDDENIKSDSAKNA